MTSQKSSPQALTRATATEVSRRYHRIVVKAGTSLLTRGGDQLDRETMETVVGQIARLHTRGAEIMLVSSGAVAAGRHVLGVPQEGKNLPLRQVLAAVGQSRLMHAYEQLFGVHAVPRRPGPDLSPGHHRPAGLPEPPQHAARTTGAQSRASH